MKCQWIALILATLFVSPVINTGTAYWRWIKKTPTPDLEAFAIQEVGHEEQQQEKPREECGQDSLNKRSDTPSLSSNEEHSKQSSIQAKELVKDDDSAKPSSTPRTGRSIFSTILLSPCIMWALASGEQVGESRNINNQEDSSKGDGILSEERPNWLSTQSREPVDGDDGTNASSSSSQQDVMSSISTFGSQSTSLDIFGGNEYLNGTSSSYGSSSSANSVTLNGSIGESPSIPRLRPSKAQEEIDTSPRLLPQEPVVRVRKLREPPDKFILDDDVWDFLNGPNSSDDVEQYLSMNILDRVLSVDGLTTTTRVGIQEVPFPPVPEPINGTGEDTLTYEQSGFEFKGNSTLNNNDGDDTVFTSQPSENEHQSSISNSTDGSEQRKSSGLVPRKRSASPKKPSRVDSIGNGTTTIPGSSPKMTNGSHAHSSQSTPPMSKSKECATKVLDGCFKCLRRVIKKVGW